MFNSEDYVAQFDFGFYPRHAESAVYRIVTATPLAGTFTMTGTVTTTGTPVFDYHTEESNTCGSPAANIRPFITTGDFDDENGRWWAFDASVTVAAGAFTLTTSLGPSHWLNVNGHHADESPAYTAAFNAALASAQGVGIALGGGCFFGHGVFVQNGTGTARFNVSALTVE